MALNPLLDIIRSSGSSARAGALAIDQDTALPEQVEVPYPQSDLVGDLDSMDLTGDTPQDVAASEPPAEPAPMPKGNPLMDIIRGNAPAAPTLPKGNPLLAIIQANESAATEQAVAEATTPTENLPVLKSDLANALGVLDYRDPEEGQRRRQAAAMGEILGLPEYEKVQLGAAPVNTDGTVTIRRAQAVSPEANAAADQQMEFIRRDAAAEMNPPNRAVEAYNRAERGARLGVEDVRSGFYSIVEDFFRPQQNPYLEKSQAAAIEDVPKLESRLADLQSRQAEFTKGDLGPNRDRISPFDDEISSIQNQLAKARQATTGEPVTENFLGSLSRASGDLSAEARENQQAIAADYTPEQIRPERNKEFWMTVADSLGRSAPTTASAILNPYLGLTLGYTQVFSNAESEFDQAAAQTGKPIDPEARAEYAHSQAVLQTPFELVGDLALAKVARDSIAASGKALMRSVKAGDPGAVTSFVSNLPRRAGQLAAAAAGETLITTPAQTVIEQKLAEAEGIRAPISNAELAARTGQAMQVAGAQSLLLGGGPVALETGVTTIADGIAARRQAPTTPPPAAPAEVPQNFTPISTPAAAPATTRPRSLGEVRAPQIAVDQAAIDEAFGSPFAPPAVNPQVNSAEDSTFAPLANEIPPAASARVASATIAPEPTGSPELASGEGVTVSPPAPEVSNNTAAQDQLSMPAIEPVSVSASEAGAAKVNNYSIGFAPNGKPSNLKPEEQQLARSPEFKTWFGNWQPKAILEGNPVSNVSTDAIPIINRKIIESAVTWIKANPQNDAKTEIGDVRIGEDDIRNSFSHSNYPNKLAVLPALRDILERGAYIGNAPDWKRQNATDHYFAAPVEIDGSSKKVFVRVISEEGNPNRLHVHEIFTQDEIDKAGLTAPSEILPPNRGMQTPPSTGKPGALSGLYRSLIRGALDVNNISGQIDENGEPLASEIARFRQEAETSNKQENNLSAPRNRKGEAGSVLIPSREDLIQAGQNLYEAGMDFAAWAGRMVQQFGESVRDLLNEIWQSVSGGQYLQQARERGSVNISPGTGPKPRKFTQSVQAAEGVMPEVKAQLNSFEYDPVSNAETVAAARAGIDAAGSIDAAFTGLMGKTAAPEWQPSAVDYATGMELMSQLQNRGRHEDAGAIANMMANRATDQGRAIQALSMISRLGPQGIEVFAQKQLQNAAVNGRNEKEKAQIQTKLDEAAQLRVEMDKVRHGATTAAIVGRRAEIKSALPAGADPVATNMAIRDAIMASPTPLAAEAATASILTGQGVSETGATRISKSIVRDFLKTSQDARAQVLQDLQTAAQNDRRLNKGKLGDLLRLNREGKLADTGLHAGMAKMLGIPHWSREHSMKVQRIIKERERATDPRIKLVKGAEILDVVYREFMPPDIASKIDTFQTILMLLNTKTIGRNVLGNTFAFAADLAADAVAIPMDALVSLGTGKRERVGISLGEGLMGLGAGFADVKAGYKFARSEGRSVIPSLAEGVNTLVRLGRLQSSGKYDSAEINRYSGGVFSMPGLRHLETTLGAVLSIADRGFYESAFRRSLDNRMKAARANGTPMLAPDKDMVDAARMDAARGIYQNETPTGELLSKMRKALNYFTSFRTTTRWGLGSMIFKFTTTPSSILHRALDFSPIGFINSSYELLAPMLSKNKEFDQKAFVDAFSQALVGTTGLVALGYWLSHLGIISAGSSADDEKKRNLEKARGWGNYKINVDALKRALMTGNFWTRQLQYLGDRTETYDWAQPLSIAVAMGAYAQENQTAVRDGLLRGKKQNIFDTGVEWLLAASGAATGAMNSLMEQPLLSGLNTFFKNASYDGLPGAIMETAVAIPGSFIPTAARQWMQLTDNSVRETRDSSDFREYINKLKAQLPGLSKTLPQKYDIAGQPVERWARDSNTIFNVMFNPGMTTYIKGSPVLTEMSRVFEMTANPSAVPNQVSREFTLEGVKVRLTDEEISAMQKDMGALSVAAVEKFVLEDPRYAKATWDIKAKAFTRALEKAAEAAKYRVLLSRPDLKTRAAAEHRKILQDQAAESKRRAEEFAAMGQLQPGP